MDKASIDGFVRNFLASEANSVRFDIRGNGSSSSAIPGTSTASAPQGAIHTGTGSPEAAAASDSWQIYDTEPLIAYGSVDNQLLISLRDMPKVHLQLTPPKEWLASAQTVIACFLPFDVTIPESNRSRGYPSWPWLHGRIEGQAILAKLASALCEFLQDHGFEALYPAGELRFWENSADRRLPHFTSNWSERHVGYVCGLGTFGLSKGLITERGTAGRIFSIVTSWQAEPTLPDYHGPLEYCIQCGKCAKKCPVAAIHGPHEKDDHRCAKMLDRSKAKFPTPYYGCGKCQCGTPCERTNPARGLFAK
ncbi:MAG: 4Fe-4S binding protein [Actinomycetia bacterium]|nr:4Fe-4S binding protein [Actinomycetes bacterium]